MNSSGAAKFSIFLLPGPIPSSRRPLCANATRKRDLSHPLQVGNSFGRASGGTLLSFVAFQFAAHQPGACGETAAAVMPQSPAASGGRPPIQFNLIHVIRDPSRELAKLARARARPCESNQPASEGSPRTPASQSYASATDEGTPLRSISATRCGRRRDAARKRQTTTTTATSQKDGQRARTMTKTSPMIDHRASLSPAWLLERPPRRPGCCACR